MNSYQKLKAKNKSLEDKIQKLYDEPEYYLSQVMANNLRKGINKAINKALLFGEPYMIHKPNGKVKFTGLFKKIISESKH